MLYLLTITLGLDISYLVLYFLFPFFFHKTIPKLNYRALPYSIFYITFFSLLVYLVCYNIPNVELSNRILHSFGGGFLSFFVCFFAAKDSSLKIGAFQFFFLSFLIVTALGVANEMAEFFLQTHTHIIFAPSITDTWLDLMSNTIGAIIALACLIPFRKTLEDV
jgi:VanZ family protein